MKKLLLVLMLVSLAFSASWQILSGMAILASFMLLLIVYMVAVGFNIDEMKVFSQDELYQLVATAILLVLLVGAESFFNMVSINLGEEGLTVQELASIDLRNTLNNLTYSFGDFTGFADFTAEQSSKSFYCSFVGTAIFISSCNAYSVLMPPLSLGIQLLAVSFAEISSMSALLDMGVNYGFTVFLPIGLFLRAFRVTRGAGGFFIALGITFYFIFPVSIVLVRDMIEFYKAESPLFDKPDLVEKETITNPLTMEEMTIYKEYSGLESCNEKDFVPQNYETVRDVIPRISEGPLPKMVFLFFVEATFFTVIVLMISLTALRWITSAGGAEVDVSALMRLT